MISFKQFIIEANELARIEQKKSPAHHSHPMGQFLQFMRDELPNIQVDDSVAHGMYKKELDSYLDTLMGEDPKHFDNLHKELTTDEEDGSTRRRDLFDVLLHVTGEAKERAYKKLVQVHNPRAWETHLDDLNDVRERVKNHIDEKASAMIKERTKDNPKFRHIESTTDIEI
jgi:hypothetical protein